MEGHIVNEKVLYRFHGDDEILYTTDAEENKFDKQLYEMAITSMKYMYIVDWINFRVDGVPEKCFYGIELEHNKYWVVRLHLL